MASYEIMDTLYIESCCTCGIVFGIPLHFRNAKIKNGTNFYCPSGHSMVFTQGKKLEDWKKLADEREEELKVLKSERASFIHQIDQLEASKAHLENNTDTA